MEQLNNPFVIYGYKGADYFCNRKHETELITRALQNERNIVLISPRRIGKTGLIHHVFEQILQNESETECFYLDINATRNLSQFIQLLGKTVITLYLSLPCARSWLSLPTTSLPCRLTSWQAYQPFRGLYWFVWVFTFHIIFQLPCRGGPRARTQPKMCTHWQIRRIGHTGCGRPITIPTRPCKA